MVLLEKPAKNGPFSALFEFCFSAYSMFDDAHSKRKLVRLILIQVESINRGNYLRSTFEYGNSALITLQEKSIKSLETIQNKFIRGIYHLPITQIDFTLKHANQPSIKDRIHHMAHKWFINASNNNNEIIEITNSLHPRYGRSKITPLNILLKTAQH